MKRHFKHLGHLSEHHGRVYDLIWCKRCLEKILPKLAINQQMEKWAGVPGGCTYLGWGAGQIKYHTIPLSHINIGF